MAARSVVLERQARAMLAELMLVALSSQRDGRASGAARTAGGTVSYTNVVIDETPLGRWKGGKQAITLPASQLATPGADRHALIVRRGRGRRR